MTFSENDKVKVSTKSIRVDFLTHEVVTIATREKNTISLGNVAYAARAPLFSREDLQHSSRGRGSAPPGPPLPRARVTLEVSSLHPLRSRLHRQS